MLLARTLYCSGLEGGSPVWDKMPAMIMIPPPQRETWGEVVGRSMDKQQKELDTDEEDRGKEEGDPEGGEAVRGKRDRAQEELQGNPRVVTLMTD